VHSDRSCFIEPSFYKNCPVFNRAGKLGVMLPAEVLQEMKSWSTPLGFRLCCLRVVVAVSEAHLISDLPFQGFLTLQICAGHWYDVLQ